MAFSTCGDYSATAHDLVKELGKLKVEMDDDYLAAEDAGKLAIQARETGKLRRRLSLTVQTALAYGTLRYANRQQRHDCWSAEEETPLWQRAPRHHRPSALGDLNGTIHSISRVAFGLCFIQT